MVGAFKNGKPFLLLGHPHEQSSVRLLYPEHLSPKSDHLLLGVRLGLPLRLQSLQGLLKHRLGPRQVSLCRMKLLLGSSCLLDRAPLGFSGSRHLCQPILGLMAGGFQLAPADMIRSTCHNTTISCYI